MTPGHDAATRRHLFVNGFGEQYCTVGKGGTTMLKDESWPVARLIPISSATGVEAQERRAVSALLAVMSVVEEFGRALVRPLGAPGGRIEAFVEVPFKVDGQSLRPDGIVAVTRAGRTWSALVEAKTGQNEVDAEQISMYIDLARQLDIDAVVTISNQLVGSSSEYPVEIDRRKLGKMALHHWAWLDVLTEAVVQREHRGVSDPDQAYILGELIRYLSDPRSGVVAFASMGRHWTEVRDGARAGTLRKSDPGVAATALRWDELLRYVALDMTQESGREVRTVNGSREKTPAARLAALQESLVTTSVLYGTLSIPNAASVLDVAVDLRARQLSASTRLDAPQDGRAKGRVSWLLRQLENAPDELRIESRAAYSSSTLAASLAEARAHPEALYPESDKEIKEFALTWSRNPGLNRDAGRGSFAESVAQLCKDFYGQVLQPIRAWKEPAPKLVRRPEEKAVQERVIQIMPEIADAVRDAQKESAAGTEPGVR